MKKKLKLMISYGLFVGLGTQVWAGEVTLPNNFTSGTPAVAAQVNANFNAVATEVNDNNTRISNNTSNKQNRVNGSCPTGSSIRAIDVNGGVTCETDDVGGGSSGVTSISTTGGLTGGGTGAVSLSIAANGVNNSMITNNAVTSGKIENGTILNADINAAAAIAVSKISGDVGIEYNNSWWEYTTIPNAVTSLGSIVVSTPGPGTILLLMNGNSYLSANGVGLTVGIGTTDNAFSVSRFLAHGGGQMPFSVMWAYNAPVAGDYTFYGLVDEVDPTNCCTVSVFETNLVALFIPKRY